ncbi:zinc finger protein RFP isoform A [Alligator mississippiensis]|uniref:Zinc finger protein RFP isoform A n=1 Tax=Alligator mississippiensis TaxID=8496 RepID=A0A151LYK4_ALLMI|nr:zinc finger protein RFP isoform A [Alligator mississippiensis]
MEEDSCGGAPIPAPAPAPTPAPAPAPGRGLQDELTCAVCLEYFRDPVMVSDCGHNFCRACVTQCWEEAGRGLCCPQCREPVPQRLFRPNRQLANIVDIVRQLDADQRAVCLVCYLAWDHRGHRVVPVEEAALGFQEAPQEHLACLRKGREESKVQRERQGEELLKQTETERQKIIAECKELRGFLEEKEQFLLSRLEELDRDIVKRKDESVFKLSEEICHIDKLLSEKGGESEPMDQTDQSVASTVTSRNWVFQKQEPGFSEVEKKLKSFSQKSAVLKEVLLEFKENLRFELENDTGDITLDPESTNPYLMLSEDKRSVRLRSAPQDLPANPKRFDYAFCVLGAEGFFSGRHYWEVEVGDGDSWAVGAARESVRRKEKIDFAPEEGIWAVGLNWKGKNWDQYQAFTSPETPLSLCERPRKIGVYLDYEGGWVAFYNADNMAPIFTFTAAFTEKIFPFFWLFYVGSSLSLCN